ncbi:MAG: Aminomethyltransferase [Planctomycetes bacterium]|nr:Aminomethyltransferase [Planctomycetota bacterium]
MPRNPLQAVHAEMGAFLVERAGTPVPARFSDPAEEHAAVRRTACAADLTSAGKLLVRGPERGRFLDALLAADVASLAPGLGAPSLLLGADGRIVTELRVAALPGAILLLLPPLTRVRTANLLARHVAATDVTIEDITESHALVTVQGPGAPDLVARTLGCDVPGMPLHGAAEVVSPSHGRVVLVRAPRTGGPGLDVLAPAGAAEWLWRRLLASAAETGGCAFGIDALDSLRIEAGRPAFGAEFDETNGPRDLPEIHDGLSRTKGCFLGREAAFAGIAQGPPARRLTGLVFESRTPAVRGDRVMHAGRAVGVVTSAAYVAAHDAAIGLGMVDSDTCAPGTELAVSDGGRVYTTVLPFLRGL